MKPRYMPTHWDVNRDIYQFAFSSPPHTHYLFFAVDIYFITE
jgi:hypothetical protein